MSDAKKSAIREIFEDASAGRMDFLNMRTLAYSVSAEMTILAQQTAEAQERLKTLRSGDERTRAALHAGVGLWIVRRYADAVQTLETIPDHADGAYFLGLCRTELGEYEPAIRSFHRAAEAGQDAFACLMGEVEAMRRSGKAAEALDKIKAAQRQNDHEAELHYQKGRCLEQTTGYEAAVEEYEKAVELNAQYAPALFRLGYWNDLRGNDDLAMDYYEKAAAVRPAHENALLNLGVLYEDRGEYEKAANLYARVVAARPQDPVARMYRKDAISSLQMYYDEAVERRQHRTAALLRIPLSEFELSARSRSCLEKMNVRTLGDLARLTEQEIMAIKNFGDTSLSELRGLLESKGLNFGVGRIPAAAALSVLGTPDPDDVMNKKVTDLDLSVRSLKCVQSLGCETVAELMAKTEKDLLACPNFGQTSLNEIKRKLAPLGLVIPNPA